jgi:RNA polymerase sigma-70 factor (ECF subfamily)
MHEGPARGLQLVDALLARGELATYQVAHAARADLLRRLGRADEALNAYRHALTLAAQEPQRRFLTRRIAELGGQARC